MEFVCDECGRQCKSKISLSVHKDTAHRIYVCNECGFEVVGSIKLRYHKQEKHSNMRYVCKECGKEFCHVNHYKNHLHVHDKSYVRKPKPKESEETRAKKSEILKRRWQDPEQRRKFTQQSIDNWKNDDFRNRVISSIKKTLNSPEGKAKRSAEIKKRYEDPAARQRLGQAISRTLKTEQGRKNHSNGTKKAWQNEEYRKKHIQAIKDSWKDEEKRKERGKKISESLLKDETRKRLSQNTKRLWQDPEYIKKQRVAGFLAFNGQTRPELYWQDLFEKNGIDVEPNGFIYGSREHCDFVNKDKRIGIEINPTYSHKSFGYSHWGLRDDMYHYSRSRKAEDRGYEVIHIWDWYDEQKMIAHIKAEFGIFDEETDASSCDIVTIDGDYAYKFFNDNSLSNDNNADIVYCLKCNDDIICAMSFSYVDDGWQSLSHCSKIGCHVVGGYQRLVDRFMNDVKSESLSIVQDYNLSNKIDRLADFKSVSYSGPRLVWFDGESTSTGEENELVDAGFSGVYTAGMKSFKIV